MTGAHDGDGPEAVALVAGGAQQARPQSSSAARNRPRNRVQLHLTVASASNASQSVDIPLGQAKVGPISPGRLRLRPFELIKEQATALLGASRKEVTLTDGRRALDEASFGRLVDTFYRSKDGGGADGTYRASVSTLLGNIAHKTDPANSSLGVHKLWEFAVNPDSQIHITLPMIKLLVSLFSSRERNVRIIAADCALALSCTVPDRLPKTRKEKEEEEDDDGDDEIVPDHPRNDDDVRVGFRQKLVSSGILPALNTMGCLPSSPAVGAAGAAGATAAARQAANHRQAELVDRQLKLLYCFAKDPACRFRLDDALVIKTVCDILRTHTSSWLDRREQRRQKEEELRQRKARQGPARPRNLPEDVGDGTGGDGGGGGDMERGDMERGEAGGAAAPGAAAAAAAQGAVAAPTTGPIEMPAPQRRSITKVELFQKKLGEREDDHLENRIHEQALGVLVTVLTSTTKSVLEGVAKALLPVLLEALTRGSDRRLIFQAAVCCLAEYARLPEGARLLAGAGRFEPPASVDRRCRDLFLRLAELSRRCRHDRPADVVLMSATLCCMWSLATTGILFREQQQQQRQQQGQQQRQQQLAPRADPLVETMVPELWHVVNVWSAVPPAATCALGTLTMMICRRQRAFRLPFFERHVLPSKPFAELLNAGHSGLFRAITACAVTYYANGSGVGPIMRSGVLRSLLKAAERHSQSSLWASAVLMRLAAVAADRRPSTHMAAAMEAAAAARAAQAAQAAQVAAASAVGAESSGAVAASAEQMVDLTDPIAAAAAATAAAAAAAATATAAATTHEDVERVEALTADQELTPYPRRLSRLSVSMSPPPRAAPAPGTFAADEAGEMFGPLGCFPVAMMKFLIGRIRASPDTRELLYCVSALWGIARDPGDRRKLGKAGALDALVHASGRMLEQARFEMVHWLQAATSLLLCDKDNAAEFAEKGGVSYLAMYLIETSAMAVEAQRTKHQSVQDRFRLQAVNAVLSAGNNSNPAAGETGEWHDIEDAPGLEELEQALDAGGGNGSDDEGGGGGGGGGDGFGAGGDALGLITSGRMLRRAQTADSSLHRGRHRSGAQAAEGHHHLHSADSGKKLPRSASSTVVAGGWRRTNGTGRSTKKRVNNGSSSSSATAGSEAGEDAASAGGGSDGGGGSRMDAATRAQLIRRRNTLIHAAVSTNRVANMGKPRLKPGEGKAAAEALREKARESRRMQVLAEAAAASPHAPKAELVDGDAAMNKRKQRRRQQGTHGVAADGTPAHEGPEARARRRSVLRRLIPEANSAVQDVDRATEETATMLGWRPSADKEADDEAYVEELALDRSSAAVGLLRSKSRLRRAVERLKIRLQSRRTASSAETLTRLVERQSNVATLAIKALWRVAALTKDDIAAAHAHAAAAAAAAAVGFDKDEEDEEDDSNAGSNADSESDQDDGDGDGQKTQAAATAGGGGGAPAKKKSKKPIGSSSLPRPPKALEKLPVLDIVRKGMLTTLISLVRLRSVSVPARLLAGGLVQSILANPAVQVANLPTVVGMTRALTLERTLVLLLDPREPTELQTYGASSLARLANRKKAMRAIGNLGAIERLMWLVANKRVGKTGKPAAGGPQREQGEQQQQQQQQDQGQDQEKEAEDPENTADLALSYARCRQKALHAILNLSCHRDNQALIGKIGFKLLLATAQAEPPRAAPVEELQAHAFASATLLNLMLHEANRTRFFKAELHRNPALALVLEERAAIRGQDDAQRTGITGRVPLKIRAIDPEMNRKRLLARAHASSSSSSSSLASSSLEPVVSEEEAAMQDGAGAGSGGSNGQLRPATHAAPQVQTVLCNLLPTIWAPSGPSEMMQHLFRNFYRFHSKRWDVEVHDILVPIGGGGRGQEGGGSSASASASAAAAAAAAATAAAGSGDDYSNPSHPSGDSSSTALSRGPPFTVVLHPPAPPRSHIKFGAGAVRVASGALNQPRLASWLHVDGCHFCEDNIPHYRLPDGRLAHFYEHNRVNAQEEPLEAAPPAPVTLGDIYQTKLPDDPPPCEAVAAGLHFSYAQPAVHGAAPTTHKLPVAKHECPGASCRHMGVIPRDCIRLVYHEEAIIEEPDRRKAIDVHSWGLEQSIYAPRAVESDSRGFYDNSRALDRSFELDWAGSAALKDPFLNKVELEVGAGAVQELKAALKANYRHIELAFRYYAALGWRDPFQVQQKDFLTFLNDLRIIDPNSRFLKSSDIDIIFIETNLEDDDADDAANAINDDNSLVRAEWTEIVARICLEMYKEETYGEFGADRRILTRCVERFCRENIAVKCFTSADPPVVPNNGFRESQLYVEDIDRIFRVYKDDLYTIYIKYCSEMRNSAEERRLMMIPEFLKLLADGGMLDDDFTRREAIMCFVQSKMVVAAEFKPRQRFVGLNFIDFLEALARVTQMKALPSDEDLKAAGAETVIDFYDLIDQGKVAALKEADDDGGNDGKGGGPEHHSETDTTPTEEDAEKRRASEAFEDNKEKKSPKSPKSPKSSPKSGKDEPPNASEMYTLHNKLAALLEVAVCRCHKRTAVNLWKRTKIKMILNDADSPFARFPVGRRKTLPHLKQAAGGGGAGGMAGGMANVVVKAVGEGKWGKLKGAGVKKAALGAVPGLPGAGGEAESGAAAAAAAGAKKKKGGLKITAKTVAGSASAAGKLLRGVKKKR